MKTKVLALAAALVAFVAVSAQEPTTIQNPQTPPTEQPAPKSEESKEESKPATEVQTPCTQKCEAKSKESKEEAKPVAEEQTPAEKPAETPATK